MDYSSISVRYAKAFFSFVSDKQKLKEVKADIDMFINLYQHSDEFKTMLLSPVIKDSDKLKSLQTTFKDLVDPLSISLLKLVVDNKRTEHFLGICMYFTKLYCDKEGLRKVQFTTAVPMEDEFSAKLKKRLESDLNLTIEIETKVNEELIGGFIMRMEDKQYDASILSKLQQIQAKLIQAEV